MQLWQVIEGKKANLIATGKYFASCDKGVTGMTLSKTRVDNRPLRSTWCRLHCGQDRFCNAHKTTKKP